MSASISLTDKEATLCQLFLDASAYIGETQARPPPQLRITGGWVRDKLLGSISHDIDISIDTMTGYTFALFLKKFLESGKNKTKYGSATLGNVAKIEANPEKSKHLETVTTKVFGFEIDLVNLRKETYVETSRNPVMEFGTPEEDALRRDSTINALFYNLQTAEVEDFTGSGLKHLELKMIKTPLDPHQTFQDDPLRMLRSVRLASRLAFQIDRGDEKAMTDSSIKQAFYSKISRERVGIEVTKMLRGPSPHSALEIIDRLGLYDLVFADPGGDHSIITNTVHWRSAYDQLLEMIESKMEQIEAANTLGNIARILLRDHEDLYLAWIVTCYIPYATESRQASVTRATTAAREAIKADNKTTRVIKDAVLNLDDIIKTKDSASDSLSLHPLPAQTKDLPYIRETHGKAVRRWGSHWRIATLYALLFQVSQAEDAPSKQIKINSRRLLKAALTNIGKKKLLEGYADWLSKLELINLLDVYSLKPIIDGRRIAEVFDRKPGPWTKKALDMVIECQLRHPDVTNEDFYAEQLIHRKKELGL